MAFTAASKLLAQPRGDAEKAFAFIDRHPNGEYEPGAVREIVDLYWDACTASGWTRSSWSSSCRSRPAFCRRSGHSARAATRPGSASPESPARA
jgi:hypothetical protein